MSTESATTTDVEQNKAVLRRYFEAITEGRTDDAWALVAEDGLWTIPGHSPLAGQLTKQQLVNQAENVVFSKLKDGVTASVTGMIGEGDQVAVQFETVGEHLDGRPYHQYYHFLFTIKDGKMWRCWEYLDTYHYVDVIVN